MDKIEAWDEHRTWIPSGRYQLQCVKAGKADIWHEGKGGWGKTEKVVLWFQIVEGEHLGAVLPMFLTLGRNGKIPQGSKYFVSWCIANGLRRPERARLKEMPPSKFTNKVFEGGVVDVRPKWIDGQEQPKLFHYSRVDALYELLVGNPNAKE